MVDVAKILNQEPFASFQSSLGELWVFKSTVKDQEALNKALPDRLEDSSSEDYVKALMKFVCFPSGTLKEGKLKPDEPALADSDLERLTAEDLETFANIYVQNNPYLFTKTHYKTKKGPEGNLVLTPSRGEIEHPKSDGESYVSYLFRLTLIQRSEKLEWAKKLSKSFSGFSGGVADSLRKNLAHGDELRRTMERLQPQFSEPTVDVTPGISNIDFEQLNRSADEARRAPFDDLARRLDQLVDSSVKSSDFMIESNAIQAQVAEELKTSGDSASLFSKANLITHVSQP